MALALLSVFFVLADALIPSSLEAGEDDLVESAVMAITLGVCIGQINLISIWAALAPGHVVVRLPWALLLTVIMWAAVCIGLKFENANTDDYYQTGVILVCAQLAAQTPLWVGAKIWKWRLASREQRRIGVEASDAQFSIQHMMAGTLFLALTLALFRFVISGEPVDWGRVRFDVDILIVLFIAMTTNLLIVVPCIWLAFLPRSQLRRALSRWALLVVFVSIAEDVILSMLLRWPSNVFMVALVTTTINLAQCWAVVVVLLRLRCLGFRLVRLHARKSHSL